MLLDFCSKYKRIQFEAVLTPKTHQYKAQKILRTTIQCKPQKQELRTNLNYLNSVAIYFLHSTNDDTIPKKKSRCDD